jgi:hypothetical protein
MAVKAQPKVDARAAERERLNKALAALPELPDEEVMELGAIAKDDSAFFYSMKRRCEFEMLRRLKERGVAEIPCARFIARTKKGAASYEWDLLSLELDVKPLLVGEEWEQLVEISAVPAHREVKVSTAKLNGLAARRKGVLLAAVEGARKVTYGEDSVEIERVQ